MSFFKKNDKSDSSRELGRMPGEQPRSPMRMTSLWFLLILLCCMGLMTFFGNTREERKDLSQTAFEEYLERGEVQSARVVPMPEAGIVKVEGTIDSKLGGEGMLSDRFSYRCEVVYSERLDGALHAKCKSVKVTQDDSFWSKLGYSLLPLLFTLFIIIFFTRRLFQGQAGGVMSFGKSRARMVVPGPNAVTLKDVAGIEEAKSEMQEIVDYLKDPLKFRRLGGKIPRGVLMVGPPGTGKTLLARAIAGEAGVPFFSVSGSDFDEMFVGVGTSRVRDMFEEGKKHAPCLIFIDELDAIGRSRYGLNEAGHNHEQTLNALLVEMDGFEANSGVIVLAATNRPDVLDKALLRPGRFDRQITVDLPDLRGRLGILKIHADKVCMDPTVDLRVVARGTAGFSGADLANLINEAALLATRTGKEAVTLAELEEARDKVCWGKERRSRHITDKERTLIAYHEAGHAMVNMLCAHTTPLHKITIIPRGIAYLGATMQLPEQDHYTTACSELLDSIAVCMGGRVTEQLVFKELSSGATADIRQATEIARNMVCSYGMSEKLGPLNYANSDGMSFLGRTLSNGEGFSQETMREIDLEIRQLVEDAESRVRALLSAHLEQLKALADALLEHETLSAAEAYKAIGMEMPPSKAEPDDLEDIREENAVPAKDAVPSENAGKEQAQTGQDAGVETLSVEEPKA